MNVPQSSVNAPAAADSTSSPSAGPDEKNIEKMAADKKVQRTVIIVFAVIAAVCLIAAVAVLASWAIAPLAAATAIGLLIGAGVTAAVAAIPITACALKYSKLTKDLGEYLFTALLRSSNGEFFPNKKELFKKFGEHCTSLDLTSGGGSDCPRFQVKTMPFVDVKFFLDRRLEKKPESSAKSELDEKHAAGTAPIHKETRDFIESLAKEFDGHFVSDREATTLDLDIAELNDLIGRKIDAHDDNNESLDAEICQKKLQTAANLQQLNDPQGRSLLKLAQDQGYWTPSDIAALIRHCPHLKNIKLGPFSDYSAVLAACAKVGAKVVSEQY